MLTELLAHPLEKRVCTSRGMLSRGPDQKDATVYIEGPIRQDAYQRSVSNIAGNQPFACAQNADASSGSLQQSGVVVGTH